MKILVIPDVHLKPRIFYRALAIMHQGIAYRGISDIRYFDLGES